MSYVRITGGLTQVLRFFHTVDPAITRKRSIDGIAIKSDAPLGVASIERLPKSMRLYDITTASGDFIANGVVSHNCFARPTHTYLDLDARTSNVRSSSRSTCRRYCAPSWRVRPGSTSTSRSARTPIPTSGWRAATADGIWEALRDSGTPGSLVTKSPLVLRDVELLQELSERSEMSVHVRADARRGRLARDRAAHAEPARIEAVATLARESTRASSSPR